MKKINELLKKHNINSLRYEKNGKCTIVYDNNKKYVIKKNKTNIYEYLSYRNFNNYPNLIIDDGYEIYEYIDEVEIPIEQKMIDLINNLSLLHKKTTYYKKINEYNYDNMYEEIKNKIDNSKNIYDELITKAENTTFMSPSEYYLARNISKVYTNIMYSIDNTNKWYNHLKSKDRLRVSVIHNNLSVSHYINNTFISWDKSKIGISVLDLYQLYIDSYDKYDWYELLKIYTDNYPLKDEELELFYALISIPIIPNLTSIEIDNVKDIYNKINYIQLTNKLISKRINEIMKKSEV